MTCLCKQKIHALSTLNKIYLLTYFYILPDIDTTTIKPSITRYLKCALYNHR